MQPARRWLADDGQYTSAGMIFNGHRSHDLARAAHSLWFDMTTNEHRM